MNFISIYENALTNEECDKIIDEFESSPEYHEKGKSGQSEIKEHVKKSTDITYDINKKSITSEIISKSLQKHVDKYIVEYPDLDERLNKWTCVPYFNVQKYEPNEGFFKPHCENCDKESSYRVLVWMYYLNDVPNGGTLFPTLEVGINAIKGRLVLWPSYWTHVHMGQISETHTKYIVTGWHGFV